MIKTSFLPRGAEAQAKKLDLVNNLYQKNQIYIYGR